MLVVKVDYQGKLINLGKNITSLEEIDQEMNKRFPDKKFHYTFNGSQVEDLEAIISSVPEGSKSLKVTAIVAQQQSDQKHQPISENQPAKVEPKNPESEKIGQEPKKASKVFNFNNTLLDSSSDEEFGVQIPEKCGQKAEQQKQKDQQKNEDEIYSCFNCNGLERSSLCQICEGKGSFNQDHPLIAIINSIVDKKLQKRLADGKKKEKEEEALKSQEQKKWEPEKVEKLEKPEGEIYQTQKIWTSVDAGESFTLYFEVRNTGSTVWPYNVQIMDQETREAVALLPALKLNEVHQVAIGPIHATEQNVVQRRYRLCAGKTYFGNKFGCKVRVDKPSMKKVLDSSFRQRVDDLRKMSKNKRSTEYLLERLKEMNIHVDNAAGIDNEIILDIMKGCEQ